MLFSSWLRNWKRPAPVAGRRTQTSPRQRAGFRPQVEVLEGRDVPSTLTVTSLLDSGAGSLRAAIAAAQSGDTIVFSPPPTTTTPTITLTNDQLTLTKDLTIQGLGADQLTISGNDASRVFEVAQGATVILSGLTITKGFGVTYGGGILNSGTLTVSNSLLSVNGATYGGGVYNAGGTLNVGNITLAGNYTGDAGGGIYNAGGSVAVSNSTLWNNQSLYGGGIYNSGGSMTITSSTISDNWAHHDYSLRGSYGGGIYNNDGAVTLSNSIISGNAAAVAGGIYNAAAGTVTVTNSTSITGNGGGPYDWVAAVDVNNLGVLYLDSTSTIAVLVGNPAIPLDPNAAQLQIRDVTIAEGNTGTTSANFTVTLSKASTETITVVYATGDGTATAGSDYQAKSGTLTFAPGETTKTIEVAVYGDRLAEPNETFFVNLSSPTNATVADGQGVGTIVDDEPRISISDVTKYEGKKGHTTYFTFTVTLSIAYDQPVTMSYRTVDGTAKTSNKDYVARTGTLTFATGETTKTVTITVKGDSKKEANEYFYLDLSDNSSNSLFSKNRGTGTILNDD